MGELVSAVPQIDAAVGQSRRGRTDVTFLFIDQGEGATAIRSYLSTQRLGLEHVLLDGEMQVSRHYGLMGMPTTLFLRADGTLESLHVGELSQDELDTSIRQLKGAT